MGTPYAARWRFLSVVAVVVALGLPAVRCGGSAPPAPPATGQCQGQIGGVSFDVPIDPESAFHLDYQGSSRGTQVLILGYGGGRLIVRGRAAQPRTGTAGKPHPLPGEKLPCDGGTASDAGGIDAGAQDAGEPDAGGLDAGELDAGELDAGEHDAGALDAGALDAGLVDGGSADAGVDAGSAAVCPPAARPPSIVSSWSVVVPRVGDRPVFASGTYQAEMASVSVLEGSFEMVFLDDSKVSCTFTLGHDVASDVGEPRGGGCGGGSSGGDGDSD